jgi:hypothetical protein
MRIATMMATILASCCRCLWRKLHLLQVMMMMMKMMMLMKTMVGEKETIVRGLCKMEGRWTQNGSEPAEPSPARHRHRHRRRASICRRETQTQKREREFRVFPSSGEEALNLSLTLNLLVINS